LDRLLEKPVKKSGFSVKSKEAVPETGALSDFIVRKQERRLG
jgi:hypothetical protein